MFSFLLLCALVVGFALITWLYYLLDLRRTNLKAPFPLPIIGNSLMFVGSSSTVLISGLAELADRYNDAAVFYIGLQRYITISHPKYVADIISSSEHIRKGQSYNYLHPWLGQGLLTSTGYRWKSHRKFLTPAFHFNIQQSQIGALLKNTKVLIEKLSLLADGKSINLFPIIALAALDIITETVMGVSVNAQKDKESDYVESVSAITEIISLRQRDFLLSKDFFFNLSSKKGQHDKALEILHNQTTKVIKARRKELENKVEKSTLLQQDLGLKNKYAFLDLLLLAEVDGNKLDDVAIREEVDTFMFEGHDTTTSGVVFLLYNLAKYEDIQEKVLKEQKIIFGDDLEREPSYSEIQRMKYLDLVIKESLRLYPAVPFVQRYFTEDVCLSGMKIPKDTNLIINVLHMHRHADVFQDPLDFRPERFKTRDKDSISPYDWLAFSAGPRNCIGQKFAMMELKIVVSSIIKKFKVLPSELVPEITADLILRSKNGVHVKLLPRC